MDRTLTWTIEESGGKRRVSLAGELTENANLTDLLKAIGGPVTLDLASVGRINSPGVREWITFVNELGSQNITFELDRCSLPFVNQLNMISNFRGRGQILSVFAPYYCPSCAKDERRLVDVTKDARAQIDAPFPCPTCKEPMEFDDVADAYLAFLS